MNSLSGAILNDVWITVALSGQILGKTNKVIVKNSKVDLLKMCCGLVLVTFSAHHMHPHSAWHQIHKANGVSCLPAQTHLSNSAGVSNLSHF